MAELLFGIGALPAGKRQDNLAAALDDVLGLFADRILPFDTSAARRYADLAVNARGRKGLPHTRRLHRRDRRRAPLRRGVARYERFHRRRPDGDRPLDRDQVTGFLQRSATEGTRSDTTRKQ